MSDQNVQSGQTEHPESGPNWEIPKTDRGRYLARGLGYTNSAVAGMRHEPEALGESDLADLARASHERAASGRRETLTAQAARISKSLEHHAAQVQYCERELRRLNRRIAAG
jgi:pyruvate/2-oxoglutarate dehydrogenase complex dihydrolipoamide acyltransferase (E2) component